jgi:hypothetical protein
VIANEYLESKAIANARALLLTIAIVDQPSYIDEGISAG